MLQSKAPRWGEALILSTAHDGAQTHGCLSAALHLNIPSHRALGYIYHIYQGTDATWFGSRSA